jgi:hypothetical protein
MTPARLRQRIVTAMRAELGREPRPEELDAALKRRREFMAAPSTERIEAAAKSKLAAAENALNDATPAGPSRPERTGDDPQRFDDCKAPAQWAESPRPKRAITAQQIGEKNRAKWADPESHMTQVVMAAEQTAAQRALADTKAAAEVRVGKAVSDFQTPRSRLLRPKKKPTHKSKVIAAMRTWRRGNNHTLAEFLAAAGVGSIPGVRITALRKMARYTVRCEAVSDKPKNVALETIKGWWKEAAKTI